MSKPRIRTGKFLAPAGLICLLGAAACSKTDDAGKPSGIPPLPAGSAAAPSPATAPPTAAAPTPPPPPAPPPPAAEEPKPDPNAQIIGEIVLAPAVKAAVSPGDAVYLVARRISDNPSARGSLVAVKKFTAEKFPIPFRLGPEDMMFKNGAFEGDLTLSARVDKDGDPMTRKKGDVVATLPKVAVGAKGVKLSLNQIQKEDESLAAPPMMGGSMGRPMGGAPGGGMPGSPHGTLPPGHP